ncbi:MAG TPA: hypothetical protein PLY00_14875 [Verrucomicrobiota bacterium]|nr:hypothetical protein [Verrucomicrobiota bacterium]HQK00564.1 hypothetical protein [Verrucomicrobiota bacterium]
MNLLQGGFGLFLFTVIATVIVMPIGDYSRRVLRRLQVKIHNTLEARIKADSPLHLDSFYLFLVKKVLANLRFSAAGAFYVTTITNSGLPFITAQARLICLLTSGLGLSQFPLRSIRLIEELTDALILCKRPNLLYSLNNYACYPQDEGIASVWAGLALIKAYEATGSDRFWQETVSIYDAMLSDLYSKKTGLVHTAGQDFWCLNASSKFAYLSTLLLKHRRAHLIEDALQTSITLCLDNIAEDGHFPYTEEHDGVYILLYHASVMFYLNNCLASECVASHLKDGIRQVNEKALAFLLRCMDSSGRFMEPERRSASFYLISLVTALAALGDRIDQEQHNMILKNLLMYCHDDHLFMYIDRNGYLTNRERYRVRDVLAVEALYWLTQYMLCS